jgi:hypothetical protein
MKTGRPTKYSKELGTAICERIAKGESLRDICSAEDMPSRVSVHAWLLDSEKKEFLNQYETACNIRAENMFDELEKIADLPDDAESPMRSRLRVDTRKWYLSKVMPKKFGDKMDVTTDGKPLTINFDNAFTPSPETDSK